MTSDGTGPISRPSEPHDIARLRQAKKAALKRQRGRCLYCTQLVSITKATIEHRLPRVRGGKDTFRNVDAACRPCNMAKGTLTGYEFKMAIFNPNYRTDPWPLYLACVEIRLKRVVESACRRLRSIVSEAPRTTGAN